MFGTHFYHERIKKSVAVFGSLFNNIYVLRKGSNGNIISTVKVPLSYAPAQKFLERIRENPNLTDDTKLAIKLPRMSFEILSFDYDNQRQLQKTNSINKVGSVNTSRNKLFTPVPYNINFQLNILSKTQDDALQIVEQIVPFFNPQYTITQKPFTKYPDIKEDTPVILNSISFTDDFEGAVETRRTIIYNMDFTMKISFHGPLSESDIIRQVDTKVGLLNANGTDSDIPLTLISVTPNPADASPDDNYGFTTTYTNLLDSA